MTKSLAALLLSGATAMGMGIAPAPAAHADAAQYLVTLNVGHVSYSDPVSAINMGQSVCDKAHNGVSFDAIGGDVQRTGYSSLDAGFIMGAAVECLCPDLGPAMDRWSNSR
jgi:hypothetical protein